MVGQSADKLRASKTRLNLSLAQFNSSAVRLAARRRGRLNASDNGDSGWFWIVSYAVMILLILLLLAILFIQFSFPGAIAFT